MTKEEMRLARNILQANVIEQVDSEDYFFKSIIKAMQEYAESYSASQQGGMREWISVIDRFPEPAAKPIYLALHEPQFDGDYPITQCGFSSPTSGIWPYVTHWMHLPTPPTNQTEGGESKENTIHQEDDQDDDELNNL